MATKERDDKHAERGIDRLVFFSDAVVAIAITLIALPLVDTARDLGSETTADFLYDNLHALAAAAISFTVIGLFWRDHHRIFNHANGHNRLLMTINMIWLAAIVFLPLATVLQVNAHVGDGFATAIYIGTMAVTMLLARLEEGILIRARLLEPGHVPSARERASRWVPTGLMILALVVVVIFPSTGLYPLALVLLNVPIQLILRRWGARHPLPSAR
jgi:uncharacterized membrane protein